MDFAKNLDFGRGFRYLNNINQIYLDSLQTSNHYEISNYKAAALLRMIYQHKTTVIAKYWYTNVLENRVCQTSSKPLHGFSSYLNGNTLWSFVSLSPKPYTGILLSSSNGASVCPRIDITF